MGKRLPVDTFPKNIKRQQKVYLEMIDVNAEKKSPPTLTNPVNGFVVYGWIDSDDRNSPNEKCWVEQWVTFSEVTVKPCMPL
jgi:hypothetical protein